MSPARPRVAASRKRVLRLERSRQVDPTPVDPTLRGPRSERREVRSPHGTGRRSTNCHTGNSTNLVRVHRICIVDRLGGFRVGAALARFIPEIHHRSALGHELMAYFRGIPHSHPVSQTSSQLAELFIRIRRNRHRVVVALTWNHRPGGQFRGHRRIGLFLRVGFGFLVCHRELSKNCHCSGTHLFRPPFYWRYVCAAFHRRVSLSVIGSRRQWMPGPTTQRFLWERRS